MIKDQIANIIKKATENAGYTTDHITLTTPPNPEFGDYTTTIAMQLAKELKKDPFEVAGDIAQLIPISYPIGSVKIVRPGFINVTLALDTIIDEVEQIIEKKEKYGTSDVGKGRRWLIEHTSPNPNKAMHLGHLRNNVTGMAIANLWEAIGIEVIRDAIYNNRGIAIAKLMWGYLKFAHKENKHITDLDYWYKNQQEWLSPDQAGLPSDKFMDQLYVKGSEDFNQDKETEKKVRQMVIDWENEDEKTWALWKTVLNYVYEGQKRTLKRLDSKWDKVWHEHEIYKIGKDIVQNAVEKGILQKLDDGAILTNLKDTYNIPDTIVLKRDGTSLYITQDLALTKLKVETYKPDKLFWVVGPEQSLALKQLFALGEQLGLRKLEDFVHIPYGYISIKGKGKMSSRSGNVVYIDDLINDVKEELKSKLDTTKIDSEHLEETLEKIAIGAIKYSILKVGRTTNSEFDFESSLSFEGDSGPYLQYTYVRCQSVLAQYHGEDQFVIPDSIRDLDSRLHGNDIINKLNKEELNLLRILAKYPEVVMDAAQNYAPHFIASYLFDLAQMYNLFYQKHPILKAEEPSKSFRLLLTKATAQVIKNGLHLLGIQTVEKM